MRSSTFLGLGLIIVGGFVLAASSGAFDVTNADRGVSVETATDENALLALEKTDQIGLEEGNFVCEGFVCFGGYREYDVEIVTISDQTPPPELAIERERLSVETENDGNPSLENWELNAVDGEYVVEAEFHCDAPIGSQQTDSTVLAFAIETSDGKITIELEREITIQCE
ncbi:hypothetical protein [Natrinema amylolyticum]|uniref:hypothetical protein n=1 Tax=Natrinema amylolyticum TaxID=2878679 RepID=UPI001CFA111D|nr:hypothetical protein [Natrinema amylolyticum]